MLCMHLSKGVSVTIELMKSLVRFTIQGYIDMSPLLFYGTQNWGTIARLLVWCMVCLFEIQSSSSKCELCVYIVIVALYATSCYIGPQYVKSRLCCDYHIIYINESQLLKTNREHNNRRFQHHNQHVVIWNVISKFKTKRETKATKT